MANRLNFKKTGDKIMVEISGSIDEEVNFAADALKEAKTVIFDFSKVSNINSCGIREWIRWLSPYDQTHVIYQNCPKIIVDQINMVDGFLPTSGHVESFYVPYYSEASGEEKHVLFSYGKEFNENGVNPPATVLDSTKKPMEIDVIESKYFRFLQKKRAA